MSQQTQGPQHMTVTLKHGFERDGTTVKEIKLRRQTWGDIRAAEEAAAGSTSENLHGLLVAEVLMQRCAGLSPDEIAQLDADDAQRITDALGNSTLPQTPTSSVN